MIPFKVKTVAICNSYELQGVAAGEFIAELEAACGQVISIDPDDDIDDEYPAEDYPYTNEVMKGVLKAVKESSQATCYSISEIQIHISW